jgi:flagellar FliL protein
MLPSAPPPLPAAPVPKHQISWDPFWIEQKDSEGVVRFLICQFTIPTDSPQLYAEIQVKKVVLRDAVFYYLRNKSFSPASGTGKIDVLKTDLITVINEHVATGKIEDLFIENYLVK